RETLDTLSKRDDVLLGIATGKSQKGLRHALESHRLRDYFVTLQTADDAPSKPHPEMLRRAMRETGIDPADTVLVGDTTFDMQMARAARAHALGVDWGYHEPHLLTQSGARAVLDDFGGLAPALDEIWTRVAEIPTGGA
ncbi:MAG: HAD-IA family hydrolase, partial [Parvibaculum sp.]